MGQPAIKQTTFHLFEEFFENFTSKYTRLSYESDLSKFFQFMEVNFPKISGFSEVERGQIIAYRNWLAEEGGRYGRAAAPKTVCRGLSAISSYFDYLVEKKECEFNPVTSVKRPRHEVLKPTNALQKEQVEELISSIDIHSESGPLHKALLLTFFTTGLRKSEILKLQFQDYTRINEHHVLEYRGKGGKTGQKVIHPMSVEAIEDYLSYMRAKGRGHKMGDWLFQPTRNPHNPQNLNKPLNPRTINEILDSYAKKIGLNFKISPHSARATFIGELLEVGVDIYKVALEVNHSSVKTTQEYDKRRKKLSDSPVHLLNFNLSKEED